MSALASPSVSLPAPPDRDAPMGWSNDSPYLAGNYAPVQTETVAADLTVIGELPADLEGVFVRTGSNPRFEPQGRHHWFDGDGMLHAVEFGNGTATYRNRWIRTRDFEEEGREGRMIAPGMLRTPDLARLPRSPHKETANTDLTFHAGRLYATWWLSGEVYEIDPITLATTGPIDFGGALDGTVPSGTMSAHPKVDPVTGELVFFGYAPIPPYLRIGVISPDGQVVHHTDIELPGPRLQHDLAITPTHNVLFDMNLRPDLANGGRLAFFGDEAARIGLVPRHGTDGDARWFEVEPFFGYHVVNAWDEGTPGGDDHEVVLVGCRIDDPLIDPSRHADEHGLVPAIADLRLAPTFHEWRLTTATGQARERQLDDRFTEFPRMHDGWLGARSRYSYHPMIAPEATLLFEGVRKHDLSTGTTTEYRYPDGWFGGETPFAPSSDAARTAEDDGYLVTFVAEEATGRSELQVLDARRVEDGPIARVLIPTRVPTGYHTEWVPGADLGARR